MHVLEHAHGLHGEHDTAGRGRVLARLGQVRQLEVLQHSHGRVESGQRLGKVALGRRLDLGALRRLGRGDRLLLLDDLLGRVGILLILGDDDHHLLDLGARLRENGLHLLDLLLELVYHDLGGAQLVQADDQPALGSAHLLALPPEQNLERREHLEVRGRRHVVVPALLVQVAARCLLDGLMDAPAHLHHSLLDHVRREVYGVERVLGDRAQRFLGPFREVVDGAVVDQTWEVAQAGAKGLAERRHADRHVKVGAHAAHVHVVQRDLGLRQTLGLRDGAHAVDDRAHVVIVEQVGHFARVQDVVEIFQEGLLRRFTHGRQKIKEDRNIA